MLALRAVIADFMEDAEARRKHTRAELRELRAALAHVEAGLGSRDVGSVSARDVQALVDELRGQGLASGRADAILDALRSVYAYAIGRGLVRTSPVVGLAPVAIEARTPTDALLMLGEQAVGWTVRVIVVAFVLIVVGLAVALA